jgi:hypothetical protein
MLARPSSNLTDRSKVNRRFRGTCRYQADLCLLLATCFTLVSGFSLGLFFGPEDEGNNFLRHVGRLSADYTAFYP